MFPPGVSNPGEVDARQNWENCVFGVVKRVTGEGSIEPAQKIAEMAVRQCERYSDKYKSAVGRGGHQDVAARATVWQRELLLESARAKAWNDRNPDWQRHYRVQYEQERDLCIKGLSESLAKGNPLDPLEALVGYVIKWNCGYPYLTVKSEYVGGNSTLSYEEYLRQKIESTTQLYIDGLREIQMNALRQKGIVPE